MTDTPRPTAESPKTELMYGAGYVNDLRDEINRLKDAALSDSALREALERLAQRHDWDPNGGRCICGPHGMARALLAQPKGTNDE